jgi:hypothetical protein
MDQHLTQTWPNKKIELYQEMRDGPIIISTVVVRHDVARVFIRELKIRCSATGTLPGRASGATPGCEASGTL